MTTIELHLTDDARRAAAAATGNLPAATVRLPLPLEDMPVPQRAALVAQLDLGEPVRFAGVPDRYGTRRFSAPLYPVTVEDWAKLSAAYAAAVEVAKAELAERAARERQEEAERMAGYIEHAETLTALPLEELHNRLTTRPDAPRSRWEELEGYGRAVEAGRALMARYDELTAWREAREARRKQLEREAREAEAAERSAWIEAHGSEHLRAAHAEGYNCQRRYITERAALELPGWEVDFDARADWRKRSCPSEAALKAALEVGARVVWLVTPPSGDPYEHAECEALMIPDFHGYEAFKF